MPLTKCRLCGKIYTDGGRDNVCPICLRRLGDLYAEVHEYMRDNEDEEFDVYKLAEAMEVSTVDIQALVDLGYLERDLGLYGTRETERKKLAQAFTAELDKMHRNKLTTYGGDIYSRASEYDTHRTSGIRTVRKR
ncbi:MAG: hypothetical protein IJS39_08390 [Synergistaceae bacterium]|nr:hypothetical protein [Synergistaceae bacterium]